MPQILAPGFELFRCLAKAFPQQDERVPQPMGRIVRQASATEGASENLPDRLGRRPMPAPARPAERSGLSPPRLRCGEKWVLRPPKQFGGQVLDPVLRISSPTGKKLVVKVLPNLVATSRAS